MFVSLLIKKKENGRLNLKAQENYLLHTTLELAYKLYKTLKQANILKVDASSPIKHCCTITSW
jgi:hypothetical protein